MAAQSNGAVDVGFDDTEIPLPGEARQAAVVPGTEPLTLRLDDLLQDENGEVVLFNDSALPVLALEASAGIVAEGTSGAHHTAAGEDVTGFRYVAFDNGLTLFYQDGLDLVIRSEGG